MNDKWINSHSFSTVIGGQTMDEQTCSTAVHRWTIPLMLEMTTGMILT